MDVNVQELQQIVGGEITWSAMPPRDGEQSVLRRITLDSRDVRKGDLFVALQGDQCHGAEFAQEAMFQGAAGVLSDREMPPMPGAFTACVPDTRLALWELAAWHRQQLSGTVVGVTGSVGKTTAREMIFRVLSTEGQGTASKKNFNNEIGVPLSLMEASPNDDYVVLELAARHAGDIESLTRMCEPDIGVITRIGDAHLGCFGSVRATAEAKTELLAVMDPDGSAVLSGDDPVLRSVASKSEVDVTWYGRSAENDVVGTHVQWHDGRLAFRVSGFPFSIPVWGRHHLDAALAAISVGKLFGRTLPEMADALSDFHSVSMRCQVIDRGGVSLINDAYNGSPISFKAALALLREFGTSGRRVVACGDMLDLGSASERKHRQLGQRVVTIGGADRLFVCGQHAHTVACGAQDAGMPQDNIKTFTSTTELLAPLQACVQQGDVLLVKASRSLRMEQLIDAMPSAHSGPVHISQVA